MRSQNTNDLGILIELQKYCIDKTISYCSCSSNKAEEGYRSIHSDPVEDIWAKYLVHPYRKGLKLPNLTITIILFIPLGL